MVTVSDISAAVNAAAPYDTAEDFDNVGLLIGDEKAEVRRCLVVLDVTAEIIEEAVRKDCTLILSHHPVIFHAMKRIPSDSVAGKLLRSGISVISAHTNADKAFLNRTLADRLGLKDLVSLPETGDCGGIASAPVPGMSASELAEYCKKALSLTSGRVCDTGKPVYKVALCCGGGGSMFREMIGAGADCYVTGDVKHDQVVDSFNAGMSMIDLGHYETEIHFTEEIQKILRPQFPEVTFMTAEQCHPFFKFI